MSIVWGSCCSNWRPTSATGACRWNVCKSRSISRVTYFFGSVLSSFPIHHPGHWYHSFSLFYQALYYVNFSFSTHKHACSYLEKYQWIFSSNKEWLLIAMNNISLLSWFGYSEIEFSYSRIYLCTGRLPMGPSSGSVTQEEDAYFFI